MKKLVLLILPVLFLMAACDNKGNHDKDAATTAKDSTAASTPAKASADTSTAGTPTMPAQVFEESTLKPVTAASVTAVEGAKPVETVSTDASGNYAFTKLTAGKTYTFTASKTGYANISTIAAYDGTTNSLPAFSMH